MRFPHLLSFVRSHTKHAKSGLFIGRRIDDVFGRNSLMLDKELGPLEKPIQLL